jgi:phage/conjugal plasmid C-4 type zinc finger TraR family protein
MDDADLADIELQRSTARAIANNKNKLKDSGIKHCIDCDITIPLKRKVASPSCTRCIDCQNYEDMKNV